MNGTSTVLSGLFAGRYDIQREIGRGGTAVVYLARDKQRDHDVAIKVLRPEFAESLGADRFLKEIRLTEQLHHPQIVPVIDSGKHEGHLYFVLPHMEGGTLRQRLDREKQLTLNDAVAITRSVAVALSHAHEKGFIHRDVKPENILFTSGQACLADFGIARALERAMGDTVTSTSIVRGTPHYMSPEQASGETQLDGRSDVYSLGCVLYEMLAGIQPFVGPTPESVIAQRLTHPPRPLRMIRRSISRSVERVIDRTLLISRADRYQTATELADALELAARRGDADEDERRPWTRYGLLAGGVAVAAIAAAMVLRPGPAPARDTIPDGDPRRVAVLYLDDLTPATVPTHVADGLTEDLIDRLGSVGALHVTSPYGVRPYRGSAIPLDSIGRALKVGTIVAGSVARSGNTMRINVRLVDAATGRQINSHTLERPWTELFALQDTLANQVAFVMRQRIGTEVALREHRGEVKSYEAWELVQRATAEMVRFQDGGQRERDVPLVLVADSLYARAEQLEPAWVLPTVRRGWNALIFSLHPPHAPDRVDSAAFARMARAQRRSAWQHRALQLANLALRRSPESAEALALRGETYHRLWTNEGQNTDSLADLAEQDTRQAVDIRPNTAHAWSTLASLLYSRGRFEEAAVAARRAFDADAFFEVRRTVFVAFTAALYAEQYDEARRWCRFGLTHYPSDVRFAECELTILGWTGRSRSDARRAWTLTNDIERRDTLGMLRATWTARRLMAAAVLARSGLRDSTRVVLALVRERQRRDSTLRTAPLVQSYVRLLLNDRDSALVFLDEYLKTSPAARAQIAQHPWFRPLRGDQRFEALVRPAR